MKTQLSKFIGVGFALVSLFVLTSGDASAQCTADPGCAADVNSPQYAQVIAADPFCCTTSWDSICANAYAALNGPINPSPECAPDCPGLGNIGDGCNDNNPDTFNDVILDNCTCAGTPASGNSLPCLALPISCGASVSGSTVGAAPDVQPLCGTSDGTGGGLWYLLSSSQSGQVIINTCGSDYDTKIRVFTGPCDELVCVAGDDDDQACVPLGQSGLLSQVIFAGEANTDYYVLVHGFGSAEGNFTLNVTCSLFDCPQLSANIGDSCDDNNPLTFDDSVQGDCTCSGTLAQTNDTPCDAVNIACGASVSGTTQGTTPDVLGLCGTTDGTGGGVWYRLNSPNNAEVVLNTCGSSFDTKLRVFSGTCNELVCVGGNDDSQTCVPLGQSGLLSTVSFTAAANTNYFILVHGFSSAAGNYTLNVACASVFDCPAINANIGDACNASGSAGTVDANCECIPNTGCNVDGGTVFSSSQLTQLCRGDGVQDFVQLNVAGNTGAGLFGIVRQSDLQVVATNTNGLFNIENLPAGNYFAGYVSVENLSQLAGITNVNQLSGCFDLSNQLAVTSIALAGGTISTGGVTQVCGGTVTVTVTGNQGPQTRFALLNQTATTVITSNQTGTFNFSPLPDGIYRIVSISFTGNVDLSQVNPPTLPPCVASSNLATVTKITCPSALLESSPNPTSGTSFVTFSVPTEEYTTLEVYDMSGRKVSELFNGVTESNTEYRLEFDGVGLPNGVYIYRLTNASEVIIEKFMIAR